MDAEKLEEYEDVGTPIVLISGFILLIWGFFTLMLHGEEGIPLLKAVVIPPASVIGVLVAGVLCIAILRLLMIGVGYVAVEFPEKLERWR